MNPERKLLRRIKNDILDVGGFRGDCDICNYVFSAHKMLFHHRFYVKDDIIYNTYPNTPEGRIQYYSNLYYLVKNNPRRFFYLCVDCHQRLEYWLQFKNKLLQRIILELSDPIKYNMTGNDCKSALTALRELGLYDENIVKTLQNFSNFGRMRCIDKYLPKEQPKMSGLDDFFWS